jgi:hypothetical protein
MCEGQIAQAQFCNARSHQAFHLVAESFEHAPNLAIDPLLQNHAQARRRDGVETRDARPLTIEQNAAGQFNGELRVPGPIEENFVFLIDFVARMGEAQRQFAIVRNDEQTFALSVEPADIEKVGELGREQIENGVTRMRIAPGRDKPGGLVQKNRAWGIEMDEAVIDFDVIAFAGLRAEIGADVAVYRHATGLDQLVAVTARTNAGGGEVAVEAHGKTKIVISDW